MLNKQGYHDYLISKKRREKLIEERLGLLDRFNTIIAQREITEITAVGEAEIVELIRPWTVSGRRNFLHNITKFLNDYVSYIKKENPAQKPLADLIENYYKKSFESGAKSAAEKRRLAILPAPEKYAVNPEYLGRMDNTQFLEAFKELQAFVISCYEDIERTPFEWGYPDFEATDGYYNRVMDILFALGLCGTFVDDGIIVDGMQFFASNLIKRHKKIDLMMASFEEMGLCFDGFSKKAESFRVFYPDDPNVAAVLCTYTTQIGANDAEWMWGNHLNSLSYRYIEDPDSQKYPSIFNAEMDYSSSKLREIQEWLYAEAEKYGFSLQTDGLPKGCINYQKGSKDFLRVRQGEREPGAGHFEQHEAKIGTKVSFIHAFEREPDKMRALCERFPDVFRLDDPGKCCTDDNPHKFADNSESSGKRCAFRMRFALDGVTYTRCGLGNFFFEDISFDDVKAILEMFLIENKIKPVA